MIVMVIVIVIREIHDSWHVMIVIIPKEVRASGRRVPRSGGRARNRTATGSHITRSRLRSANTDAKHAKHDHDKS